MTGWKTAVYRIFMGRPIVRRDLMVEHLVKLKDAFDKLKLLKALNIQVLIWIIVFAKVVLFKKFIAR